MKTTCNYLLLLLFAMSFSACKKFYMEKDVPPCIEETTRSKAQTVTNTGATVLEFEFQGKLVYVFDLDPGQDNSKADILNTDCETIGYLGGVEKNREVNGEDFSSAIFKRKVWPAKSKF